MQYEVLRFRQMLEDCRQGGLFNTYRAGLPIVTAQLLAYERLKDHMDATTIGFLPDDLQRDMWYDMNKKCRTKPNFPEHAWMFRPMDPSKPVELVGLCIGNITQPVRDRITKHGFVYIGDLCDLWSFGTHHLGVCALQVLLSNCSNEKLLSDPYLASKSARPERESHYRAVLPYLGNMYGADHYILFSSMRPIMDEVMDSGIGFYMGHSKAVKQADETTFMEKLTIYRVGMHVRAAAIRSLLSAVILINLSDVVMSFMLNKSSS